VETAAFQHLDMTLRTLQCALYDTLDALAALRDPQDVLLAIAALPIGEIGMLSEKLRGASRLPVVERP
jgi:hypothetical protein